MTLALPSGFGVISSTAVEFGFRKVDRLHFVPRVSCSFLGNLCFLGRHHLTDSYLLFLQNRKEMAHTDQPLKEGNVHISAPHIYATVLEALDLHASSSLSFLNAGSGTGYLTCLAAAILGPHSMHYCTSRY